MRPKVTKASETPEFYTEERCYIRELLNSAGSVDAPENEELSIALARVEKGVTTEWHALRNTSERYLIIEGNGLVELSGLKPAEVGPGDLVEIPADCHQRITNTGNSDLLFYAVCTPRFQAENYSSAPELNSK